MNTPKQSPKPIHITKPRPPTSTKRFNNGLVPVPADTLLYEYQRLALTGRLWVLDDHLQVLSIVASTHPTRTGFVGLVYNRDSDSTTSTYYKHLGRAFLTSPAALTDSELLEPEIQALAFIRQSLGYLVTLTPPSDFPSGLSGQQLDEIESEIENAIPSAIAQYLATQKTTPE